MEKISSESKQNAQVYRDDDGTNNYIKKDIQKLKYL